MIGRLTAAVMIAGSVLAAGSPALAETSGSSAGPADTSGRVSSTTGTAPELPRTGNDIVLPGMALGLTLVVAGAGAIMAGRRRLPGCTG